MHTHEREIYYAILVLALILGMITFFFIYTIIRHQRSILKIHREKIQAEVITLETERQRVSADLHDELGPLLSAVKLKINSLDVEKEDQAVIKDASKNIDHILERIREISIGLMPQALLKKGLVTATNEFVNDLNDSGRIKIDFQYQPDLVIEKAAEIHLYRIIQELIHNTVKHAHSDVLTIQLKSTGNKTILEVEDNGLGFDIQTVLKDSTGMGLKNLLTRTEMLNGEMFIQSRLKQGTKFTFEFPNNNQHERA
jgi:signal transduction histidine kinase